MHELRAHRLVPEDLREAIAWYEGRSVGLGERFATMVDARFDDILASPESFSFAFDDAGFRYARVARFPYLILFRVRARFVYVLGIFPSASDPEKWRLRTGEH